MIYVYKLRQSRTKRTNSVRDLIFQDLNFISISMLTIYSYTLSVLSCLDLVLSVTFFFSSLECLYTLYYTLIEPKLEYATLVWNSITSTDADKLESTQQKLATLCLLRLSTHPSELCFVLEYIKLDTLPKENYHIDALSRR